MSRRTRTMAVLLSAGALAGGGTASTAQAHHNGRGHHHHHWGHKHHNRLAKIANELGVTKDQLKTALQAVKAQDPQPQSKDAFVAALAQQLNVPEDKVAAAFSCDHGDND
jgi:Spy/CpxP family protein refolding chaperone